jgi:hypothetical protein
LGASSSQVDDTYDYYQNIDASAVDDDLKGQMQAGMLLPPSIFIFLAIRAIRIPLISLISIVVTAGSLKRAPPLVLNAETTKRREIVLTANTSGLRAGLVALIRARMPRLICSSCGPPMAT